MGGGHGAQEAMGTRGGPGDSQGGRMWGCGGGPGVAQGRGVQGEMGTRQGRWGGPGDTQVREEVVALGTAGLGDEEDPP